MTITLTLIPRKRAKAGRCDERRHAGLFVDRNLERDRHRNVCGQGRARHALREARAFGGPVHFAEQEHGAGLEQRREARRGGTILGGHGRTPADTSAD
jgi:hypothetical protein